MGLQREGLLHKGGKRLSFNACCFHCIRSSIFLRLTSLSLFSLLSLSTLCVDCLSSYPPFVLWVLFLFILNQAYAISLFYPCCSPIIFACYKHPSNMPTTLLTIWVWPSLHLGMPSVFSFYHYLSRNKFLFISFCHVPLSLLWRVKHWVFLYQSL